MFAIMLDREHAQYEAAVQMASKMLGHCTTRQERVELLWARCRGRRKLGDYVNAIEDGHQAIVLAEEENMLDLAMESRFDVALALSQIDQYAAAAERWRWILGNTSEKFLTPDLRVAALFNLANTLQWTRRNEDAIAVLKEALIVAEARKHPELIRIRQTLTFEHLRSGHVDDAESLLEQTELDLDLPSCPPGLRAAQWCHRGMLLWAKGARSDAWDYMVRAIQLQGTPPEYQARGLLLLGHWALELSEHTQAVASALEAKGRAELAQRGDLVAEAMQLLQQVQIRDPLAPQRLFESIPIFEASTRKGGRKS